MTAIITTSSTTWVKEAVMADISGRIDSRVR
jgi:hypothetical protein